MRNCESGFIYIMDLPFGPRMKEMVFSYILMSLGGCKVMFEHQS
jgi:hypothetical protein